MEVHFQRSVIAGWKMPFPSARALAPSARFTASRSNPSAARSTDRTRDDHCWHTRARRPRPRSGSSRYMATAPAMAPAMNLFIARPPLGSPSPTHFATRRSVGPCFWSGFGGSDGVAAVGELLVWAESPRTIVLGAALWSRSSRSCGCSLRSGSRRLFRSQARVESRPPRHTTRCSTPKGRPWWACSPCRWHWSRSRSLRKGRLGADEQAMHRRRAVAGGVVARGDVGRPSLPSHGGRVARCGSAHATRSGQRAATFRVKSRCPSTSPTRGRRPHEPRPRAIACSRDRSTGPRS